MPAEIISGVSIESEMKKSYLDYAMSVIIGRALPDVRDGLKPVHRRILYAMQESKNDWNKPYKKSARIVGDVMGKYHPHGDSAIYDTIVRMAQDFSLRYPLVNGQGNFGSVDGDPPAAMRYTEIRMMRIAHQMLTDLDKDTVEWVPNYDDSLTEPTVLPSKLPNLLINGSSGIAVGMATNIPPHNLTEITAAIIALIDNPAITLSELMQIVPGPDFPTGGIIYGISGIYSAYKTGRGVIRIRAQADIETDRRTNLDTIVVTELPYQVNKARLIKKIDSLVKNKLLEGIRYVRDESDREGMRIAIALKKDQIAEVVMNQLFKHTQMENTFGIIFLAVVNNRPEILTLKEILKHFIRHRKEIIIRRTLYELNKAQARAHILDGLKIALDHIDEAVALIRASQSPAEAKNGLMQTFDLTRIQAQAILDMRLQRLTGLESDKIIEELQNVILEIKRLKEILDSELLVENIIKDELSEIRDEFADRRRTRIAESTKEITLEDMIAEEDMVVTISRSGYIKRNPLTLYQNQHRGGKGKIAMSTKDEDFVEHLFVASTHHTFLFFTNLGRVYWSKVYEIPETGRTSRGKAIVNLLNFETDEKLATVMAVPSYESGYFITMATKNGLVKKTDIMAYSRPRGGGIIALTLVPGDELITARITDGSMNVFLSSAMGQTIRFKESDVRPTGRPARGVLGIRLAPEDRIIGMDVLSYGHSLFTITENGYGKRTPINEYPIHKRGGKGVINIKTSDRNGQVVSILLVDEDDDLMLMTDNGKLIRTPANGISLISRNTQGVKIIGMSPEEKVTGAACVPENDDDDTTAEIETSESPKESEDLTEQ
ncbi:DNA gyrase subunit A [Desulfococcaceae bacterium HSG9]|nr:DNA gyrase subunit A [Desulfococcaceae bacterium HSG9]